MSLDPPIVVGRLDRRDWLRATAAAGLAGFASGVAPPQAAGQQTSIKEPSADPGKKTRFQIACMTLPYARFPLQRAMTGLQAAGYRYIAWGTTHTEGGDRVPVIAGDAPPERAKELGRRCRELG